MKILNFKFVLIWEKDKIKGMRDKNVTKHYVLCWY